MRWNMPTNRNATRRKIPMDIKKPLLLLLALWLALVSLPTPAQHSRSTKTARRLHHTRHRLHHARHHGKRTRKKAAAKKSLKVWVNTNSGVYHYPGMRWYGNTKYG